MELLKSVLEDCNIPIVSAFILGLMTSVSPCPLASNITATAYISKNISNKKRVFLSGVIYSLGRAFSYTAIGVVLFFGASKFHVGRFFQQNGEKYLGPLLIIIGLIMLNIIRLNFLGRINFTERLTEKMKNKGLLGAFLIGVLFALAFCPYSGALYFGMLIPMTISSMDGLYLPIIFAFGTGIPVILFTYILAFAAGSLGVFYNRITNIEKWMRTIAGVVFVLTGVYYVLIFTEII